jgi:tetratricopeptide (TPR) repeat protein
MRLLALSLLVANLLPAQQRAAVDRLQQTATAAREANRTEEAVDLYGRALKANPAWTEGWWFLGTLDYESDQYIAARDAFRRLLSNEPKMATGWSMLGLCEFETKQYDESLAHLTHAIELGLANHAELLSASNYHRALLLTRNGEFEGAMELMAEVAARGQDNPKTVEAMGIAALRKPVLPSELAPGERELVMGVGRAMSDASARRTADAASEFDALIRQNLTIPQLHFLYGIVLLLNDPDKALVQLKQELDITPRHPQALFSIAEEYVKRSDFKAALPFAESAAEANPHFFAAHSLLGRVLVEGQFDLPRGMQELELAEKMAPQNAQVRFALAGAYAKVGRTNDAARERAEFMKLRKENASAPAERP